MKKICDDLIFDGWREYPDGSRKYARCFYKRFSTPTRCACNDDKDGMQAMIAVSEFAGRTSMELELCGELKDGTWLKIENYSLPKTAKEVAALVPRLLFLWESTNITL